MFGKALPNPKFQQRIPSFKSRKGDFFSVPINKKNPKYKEKLVDLKKYGIVGVNYYHSSWNPPYYQSIPGSLPRLLARKTVAEKLARINKKIVNSGLEIFIFDAFRPLAVQEYISSKWLPRYFRKIYPHKNQEWRLKKISKYWPTCEGENIPPHLTGGAIDLTLRHRASGQFLEMGTIFDDIDLHSRPDYFEKSPRISLTAHLAKENRRVLFNLMKSEKFVCHPNEWWHFSFGDQMWAFLLKRPHAFYGSSLNKKW